MGGGPRVVVSTAAFHARAPGSLSRFRRFERNKNVSSPFVKLSIVGSLRDREVVCSASDLQGLNFASCVLRAVSSHSSHHPQEVLPAQYSLYVHNSGLKPDSFYFFYTISLYPQLIWPFTWNLLAYTQCSSCYDVYSVPYIFYLIHPTPFVRVIFLSNIFVIHSKHFVVWSGSIHIPCNSYNATNRIVHIAISVLCKVLIQTLVKWSKWNWSTLPRDTTWKQRCASVETGETWYPSKHKHFYNIYTMSDQRWTGVV